MTFLLLISYYHPWWFSLLSSSQSSNAYVVIESISLNTYCASVFSHRSPQNIWPHHHLVERVLILSSASMLFWFLLWNPLGMKLISERLLFQKNPNHALGWPFVFFQCEVRILHQCSHQIYLRTYSNNYEFKSVQFYKPFKIYIIFSEYLQTVDEKKDNKLNHMLEL